MLYCSILLPYFTYLVKMWGHTYKTNLKTLRLQQKKKLIEKFMNVDKCNTQMFFV